MSMLCDSQALYYKPFVQAAVAKPLLQRAVCPSCVMLLITRWPYMRVGMLSGQNVLCVASISLLSTCA